MKIVFEDRSEASELYTVLPENRSKKEWEELLADNGRIIYRNRARAEELTEKMRIDALGLMKAFNYSGAVVVTLTPEHPLWKEFIKEAV